jgi:hypothetical protein
MRKLNLAGGSPDVRKKKPFRGARSGCAAVWERTHSSKFLQPMCFVDSKVAARKKIEASGVSFRRKGLFSFPATRVRRL